MNNIFEELGLNDEEKVNKIKFALAVLKNKDDYSYGIISSDFYDSINTLTEFVEEIIEKYEKE